MKLINDTLKINGKWAHKRLMAFACFHSMLLYVFAPTLYPVFEVKEFVVIGFLGFAGACLGIDLQQQIKINSDNNINTTTVVNNETIG